MNYFFKCFKQYADFKTRARRKEFWLFTLFNSIVSFVLGLIFGLIGVPALAYVYTLAVFIPALAVVVRRLHDVGKSGWWYFIALIPIIGWIWLFVLMCTDSQPETNQWGANPKA